MRRGPVGYLLASLLLGGCSWTHGLYNVSLPGGADVGDHPRHVIVQVRDALDLVPQSGVKVNDVAVGKVTSIALSADRRSANVAIEIRGDVRLPANAVAAIDQTSLLGEKYVALAPPSDAAPVGLLADHAVIGMARTTDGVEAEQVFGALALLLNGGGIGQLHDIAASLNSVAHGHEADIRAFLTNMQAVVGQINAHRTAITGALDSLAALSHTLRSRTDTIARVLRDVAPGLTVLADQRTQLVGMLTSLDRLSGVTVATLKSSEDAMINDLKALAPTVNNLAAAGADLPRSLQVLATYPFTDAAVTAIRGDYLNTFVTMALNTPGGVTVPAARRVAAAPPAGLLPTTSSAVPGLGAALSIGAGN